MEKSAKEFGERLNKCLDDLDMPANIRERSIILSKMLHIPKQQAWAILEGQLLPDSDLVDMIASELEVDPETFNKV